MTKDIENPETIEIHGLKTIHKLCKFGADNNMEGCTFTEIVERMFSELKKLESCVVVPVEPTDEWMANYIDSGVENYCEEFIGQKFAVKEHEKPFIKEEWHIPVRNAHALILKVVEAAIEGNN